MPLALSALALDSFAGAMTITRRAAGSYVNGLWVEGGEDEIPIQGVALAITPRGLMDLPEGIRESAAAVLYSRTEIRPDDETTWRGVSYRVTHVWDRVEGGFFKATLAKVGATR